MNEKRDAIDFRYARLRYGQEHMAGKQTVAEIGVDSADVGRGSVLQRSATVSRGSVLRLRSYGSR